MKTKITPVLVSLIVLMGCQPEKPRKTSLDELNLSGKVKSVREISYEAVDLIDFIAKGDRKRENPGEPDSYRVFDSTGNLTEEILFQADNGINRKTTFRYEGREIVKTISSPDSSLSEKCIMHFSNKGYLILETDIGPEGKLQYKRAFKYDRKGNLRAESVNDFGGIATSSVRYRYDNRNRLMEEVRYDRNGKQTLKIVTKYAEGSGDAEKSVYDANGILGGKDFYRYDGNGNEVIKNLFTPSGELMMSWSYRYESDSAGNWIKRTSRLGERPRFIVERIIAYY